MLALFRKLVLGAAVLVAAVGAWLAWAPPTDTSAIAVGGRGVAVTRARAPDPTAAAPQREPAGAPTRTDTDGRAPNAAPATIHGFVFVDDRRTAPSDLQITCSDQREASVDVALASWSMPRADSPAPVTLWVTSRDTVPAQIPVPAAVLNGDSAFDLHLATGRAIELTFLDTDSRTPLADLDFEVTTHIELERRAMRVHTRGAQVRHRTDTQGRATVRGLPTLGSMSVVVDSVREERALVLANGQTIATNWPATSIFDHHLRADTPAVAAHTIYTRRPFGRALGRGQLPAWLPADAREDVRVVIREAIEGTRQRGEAFAVPIDAQGEFRFAAGAPSRFRVWLERSRNREVLSAVAEARFGHAGEEVVVELLPLTTAVLEVVCENVPTRGALTCQVFGEPDAPPTVRSAACAGQSLTLQVPVATGQTLLVALSPGSDPHDKTRWTRQIDPAELRHGRLTVDLAGAARTLALHCGELPPRGDAVLSMIRCRDGQLDVRERITAPCSDGRSAPVHVPPGRWLCHYVQDRAGAILAVVDVVAHERGEVVIAATLQRAPLPGAGQTLRLDRVGDAALDAYPEPLRRVPVPSGASFVWIPVDARTTLVDGGR